MAYQHSTHSDVYTYVYSHLCCMYVLCAIYVWCRFATRPFGRGLHDVHILLYKVIITWNTFATGALLQYSVEYHTGKIDVYKSVSLYSQHPYQARQECMFVEHLIRSYNMHHTISRGYTCRVNIRTLHSYSTHSQHWAGLITHTHMQYMFTLYKLQVQGVAHKIVKSYHSMLNLLLLGLTTWVRSRRVGDFLQEQLIPVLQLHTVRGRGTHAMSTVGHPPPHKSSNLQL